jgi:hypothetical protein
MLNSLMQQRNGAAHLEEVVTAYTQAIHTIMTYNGVALIEQPRHRNGLTTRFGGTIVIAPAKSTSSSMLTKPYHPWTYG